ncbi:MAG TPA: rhodanese-like domain-containing protein [Candidatus Limnocylindrales bacterium]|nr:rhodanese-like domain-containing protein [Candidatus Limnocylindrales bacterium]
MDLELFVTPGLGDASYLLASGGEAVLVDPQRDAWRFLEVAAKRGWRVRYVLETHVHNDYLSGAMETRAATGAEIAAPARGGYTFEHRAMDEGDEIEIGGLRLNAWATPGHTPEHISWAVDDGGENPIGVFTGGSLLVGSAGRTDLLGSVLTDALTRDQQRTLQRLATLPDTTEVLPTHGAGSFCSAGPGSSKRVSTIAAERFANPTFRAASEPFDAFRAQAIGGLGRYPAYYAQMAPINRAGPRVLGKLTLPPPLDAAAFEAAASAGATIVDARDRAAFAAGHIRGALNIELDGTFAGYVGWLVPFASKVILVLPDGGAHAAEAAVTELLRIGYEWVPGFLDGGMDAWAASGREVATFETTTMGEMHADRALGDGSGDGRVLLDVRQPIEWQQDGVVPGAERIFVADLPARIAELQGAPVTVFCRSGSRAAIAASMLDAAGVDVRVVTEGGAARWPEPLELLPPL